MGVLVAPKVNRYCWLCSYVMKIGPTVCSLLCWYGVKVTTDLYRPSEPGVLCSLVLNKICRDGKGQM